eukprot:m.11387 g.11387  ORF g.11387 m.11387 type:complete len:131 (+) comp5714_c0_seq2:422-814(+)
MSSSVLLYGSLSSHVTDSQEPQTCTVLLATWYPCTHTRTHFHLITFVGVFSFYLLFSSLPSCLLFSPTKLIVTITVLLLFVVRLVYLHGLCLVRLVYLYGLCDSTSFRALFHLICSGIWLLVNFSLCTSE